MTFLIPFDFILTFFCGMFLTSSGFPSLPLTPDPLVALFSGVLVFAGDLVTFISNLLGVAMSVFWNREGFLVKGLESNKLFEGFSGDYGFLPKDKPCFFWYF